MRAHPASSVVPSQSGVGVRPSPRSTRKAGPAAHRSAGNPLPASRRRPRSTRRDAEARGRARLPARRDAEHRGAFGRQRDPEPRARPDRPTSFTKNRSCAANRSASNTGEYSWSRNVSSASPCTPTIIVGGTAAASTKPPHCEIPRPSPANTTASGGSGGTYAVTLRPPSYSNVSVTSSPDDRVDPRRFRQRCGTAGACGGSVIHRGSVLPSAASFDRYTHSAGPQHRPAAPGTPTTEPVSPT